MNRYPDCKHMFIGDRRPVALGIRALTTCNLHPAEPRKALHRVVSTRKGPSIALVSLPHGLCAYGSKAMAPAEWLAPLSAAGPRPQHVDSES
jgi:hypothetical protein